MKYKYLIIHFLIPLVFVFLSQYFSYISQPKHQILPQNTIMIPVNYILWLCLYNLCFSLFYKTYKSIFLFLFIATTFTLVNYFKIKLLYQVFAITDLSQTKNLLLFLPDFINQPKIIFIFFLIIIFLTALFFLLKKYCHNKNPITARLILFPISIFILTIPLIFTNQYDYFIREKELPRDNANSIENSKLNGVLFYFIDNLKFLKKNTPENYSSTTIQNIFSNLPQDKITKKSDKPNIIVILSEALFDVTKLPNINFSQDPIKNIRSDMKATMISSQLNGGTANVEFEVITGLSNYFYDYKIPYNQVVRQKLPSLFTQFKEQGYQTTVIHPYLRSM